MQGISFNLLNANPTNWLNTLKQFVSNLPTNCVGVFDHFVELALKELKQLKVAKKSGSSFCESKLLIFLTLNRNAIETPYASVFIA